MTFAIGELRKVVGSPGADRIELGRTIAQKKSYLIYPLSKVSLYKSAPKAITSMTKSPALSAPEDIKAFTAALRGVADQLHTTLSRLSMTLEGTDSSFIYELLTEEYALRARINTLQNAPDHHILCGVSFSQTALLTRITLLEKRLAELLSFEEVQSLVSELLTFASALCPGREGIVNFLAQELGVKG